MTDTKALKHISRVLNILSREYYYWKKLARIFTNWVKLHSYINNQIPRRMAWFLRHSSFSTCWGLWLGRVSVGLSLRLPKVSVSPLALRNRNSFPVIQQLLNSCSSNCSQTQNDTEIGATLPRVFIPSISSWCRLWIAMDEAWMEWELWKDGKNMLSSDKHMLPGLTLDNIQFNLKQFLWIIPGLEWHI